MGSNQNYIDGIKKKFGLGQIESCVDKLKSLNALIIGDTIIDEYVFVNLKGRATKDPILSVGYRNHEVYAGGILAIAGHTSSYVNKIKVVTLVGNHSPKMNFIKKSLPDNVELKIFTKENSPTTLKKRYIDHYKNNKLFKIEFMNDSPINKDLTEEIVNYLNEEIPKYDLVVVGDFGHGFINDAIREVLKKKSKFLSIDVQSNSANMGYNYINHYNKVDFIKMDEPELRLPLMRRYEDIEEVIAEFNTKFGYSKFLVSLGKQGSLFFNNGHIYKSPILIDTVVDTTGAGDAVFAIATILMYIKADNELIPFIANCAGGIKTNIMGNKESVTKEKLMRFIKDLLE